MAVTELRTFMGLGLGETAAAQCPSQIDKDLNHMNFAIHSWIMLPGPR